jgi:hypothetical protein
MIFLSEKNDIPGEVVPCSDWSSPEVLAKGLQHLAERQKVGGLRYPAVPRSILWLRTGFSEKFWNIATYSHVSNVETWRCEPKFMIFLEPKWMV